MSKRCFIFAGNLLILIYKLMIMKKILPILSLLLFLISPIYSQNQYDIIKNKLQSEQGNRYNVRSFSSHKLIDGSLDALKNENKVGIAFDYSEASINGYSIDELINSIDKEIQYSGWEKEDGGWDANTRDNIYIKGEFTSSLNVSLREHGSNLKAAYSGAFNYKLVVCVIDVDNCGDTFGIINLVPVNSTQILAKIAFYSPGGRHGSISNLLGDAMQRAGESIGRLLARKTK